MVLGSNAYANGDAGRRTILDELHRHHGPLCKSDIGSVSRLVRSRELQSRLATSTTYSHLRPGYSVLSYTTGIVEERDGNQFGVGIVDTRAGGTTVDIFCKGVSRKDPGDRHSAGYVLREVSADRAGLDMVPLEPVQGPASEIDHAGPLDISEATADAFYNDFDVSDMFGPSSLDFLFTADTTLGT